MVVCWNVDDFCDVVVEWIENGGIWIVLVFDVCVIMFVGVYDDWCVWCECGVDVVCVCVCFFLIVVMGKCDVVGGMDCGGVVDWF